MALHFSQFDSLTFEKMHALGNDFMIVLTDQNQTMPSRKTIQQWGCRHQGIGFDQFLWASTHPNHADHLNVYITNSDGTSAKQCGNGLRCLAALWARQNNQNKPLTFVIGHLNYQATFNQQFPLINMGKPKQHTTIQTVTLNNQPFDAALISIGNNHLIVHVPNAPKNYLNQAHILRQDARLARPMNISFMHIEDNENIALLTDENGAGPTLSCASASCAAAFWAHKSFNTKSKLNVKHQHGALQIATKAGDIQQSGPISFVFSGTLPMKQPNSEAIHSKTGETA
jgi:diaminopimelate epimerase